MRKDEVSLQRAQILKAVRSAVRLKHSLAADRELNEVLPQVEAEFDAAIAAGKVYELDVHSILMGLE